MIGAAPPIPQFSGKTRRLKIMHQSPSIPQSPPQILKTIKTVLPENQIKTQFALNPHEKVILEEQEF